MSAAALEPYPLKSGASHKMSSFSRRGATPSGLSATSSYSSSIIANNYNTNNAPSAALLSTREDSGNANNRGHLQRTSSVVSNGNGSTSAAGGPAARSTSVARSSSRSRNHHHRVNNNSGVDSSGGELPHDGASETVIEEKRKRTGGDGFSIHRYTLGRLLGKGGFAKVYLCTAMDTGKNYAVKVVPKANLVKARARQKLQAEIKIHRGLKHRYVCQYKHYFEDRNNCYILLELCHNQSLNEMIKRRKRLTEPEAAFFMAQLLEATRYMHGENVIHRDLKLGNLFLDKDMNVKVGDLGLATLLEHKDEKRKTICGTPNYIAPEIIQGDKAKRGHSFEVDVWSMGVILYTVLIGKPPYEAKDVKATYQRILNNEYSFPRHADISAASKSLIKSMLQSKPSDRPTLDEIEAHPFLVDCHMPAYLPSSVLSLAPTWRLDDYGELVCTEKLESKGKSLAIPRATSRSRQPFGARDPNMRKGVPAGSGSAGSTKQPRKEERDVVNMERVVKQAYAAMTGTSSAAPSQQQPKKTPSRAFAIFDESEKQVAVKPQSVLKKSYQVDASREAELGFESRSSSAAAARRQKPPPLTEEALSQQTRALSITGASSSKGYTSGASSVFTHATESVVTNTENDADILQHMVDHLDTVISVTESRKGSYRSIPLHPLSTRRGPSKWVTRYVDYTSKYGLGFLLNDGSSGVYFNDSTKTALEREGDTFQYIERKKGSDQDGSPVRRGETTVQSHNLENYPESLKKKVTLLKHFRNYLLQQQLSDGDSDFTSVESSEGSSDLVYVKKWVRTKHAILFSLSNRTVQVIFYDQTEILLTPDVAFLTYVDKHRKRSTYNFNDELIGASGEIEKRLKYTKEIMLQLLPGPKSS